MVSAQPQIAGCVAVAVASRLPIAPSVMFRRVRPSPTVTLNVYSHLLKETNQEAVCRLEDNIFDSASV
jgi:hypothetical protein